MLNGDPLDFLLSCLVSHPCQQVLQQVLLLYLLDRQNVPQLFKVLLDLFEFHRCLVDLLLRGFFLKLVLLVVARFRLGLCFLLVVLYCIQIYALDFIFNQFQEDLDTIFISFNLVTPELLPGVLLQF